MNTARRQGWYINGSSSSSLQRYRLLLRAVCSRDSTTLPLLPWSHQDQTRTQSLKQIFAFRTLGEEEASKQEPSLPRNLRQRKWYYSISWYVKQLTCSVTYGKVQVLWMMLLLTSPMTSLHCAWSTKQPVMHWCFGGVVTPLNRNSSWRRSRKSSVP